MHMKPLRKKYLMYHPADIFTYSLLMMGVICPCIWMITKGYIFLYGPLAVLFVAAAYTFCFYARTVSFDDVAIYCYGPFFKKRAIPWSEICCYGCFLRQSLNYKREFIYFSTKPLQDTRFLLGIDMPKVSNTLFIVAYRPDIKKIMLAHGLK